MTSAYKDKLLLHFAVVSSALTLELLLENQDNADEIRDALFRTWRESMECKLRDEVEEASKEFGELGTAKGLEQMNLLLGLPTITEHIETQKQKFAIALDETELALINLLKGIGS